jgi:hypothetical protein
MDEIKACMNDILDKVCQREYNRRNYQKNKEKIIKKQMTWNKKNTEKVRVYQRKCGKSIKGKERIAKAGKNYYQKNKEILIKKKAESNSIRYWKDPESSRKKHREWSDAYNLKYA